MCRSNLATDDFVRSFSNAFSTVDLWHIRFPAPSASAEIGVRHEILHDFEYNPLGNYYGMPEWLAAVVEMGLARTIMTFNLHLFKNSLMAHVAVVVEEGRGKSGLPGRLRVL